MKAKNRTVYIDEDAHIWFGPPNLTGTPERRLLLAVLERAILDFVGNDRKEVEAAEEWLFDEDVPQRPFEHFSLPWICQELDLDFAEVVDTVRNMPKRGKSRVAPWYLARAS